jgi:hypothetical protein
MKCGSRIAVAVVGGYVLGRSRKTRLAALLALLAAGGDALPVGPEDLLRKSPLGGPLDKLTGDLRGQLVDAGMSVAKKAASSRIDSFSDKLQERAETLRGAGTRRRAEPEEAEEAEEVPERARPRRERPEPPRRRREEPARRERDRDEPSRRGRTAEPEYDEDEYDEYEDYDDYDRDEGDRGDYEADEYDEDERDEYEGDEDEDEEPEEPERRPRQQRRAAPSRPSRPEPRRRAPRREDDRPRRGRSPR